MHASFEEVWSSRCLVLFGSRTAQAESTRLSRLRTYSAAKLRPSGWMNSSNHVRSKITAHPRSHAVHASAHAVPFLSMCARAVVTSLKLGVHRPCKLSVRLNLQAQPQDRVHGMTLAGKDYTKQVMRATLQASFVEAPSSTSQC